MGEVRRPRAEYKLANVHTLLPPRSGLRGQFIWNCPSRHSVIAVLHLGSLASFLQGVGHYAFSSPTWDCFTCKIQQYQFLEVYSIYTDVTLSSVRRNEKVSQLPGNSSNCCVWAVGQNRETILDTAAISLHAHSLVACLKPEVAEARNGITSRSQKKSTVNTVLHPSVKVWRACFEMDWAPKRLWF